MFLYVFSQNTSTLRDFTIFYPQNLHCCMTYMYSKCGPQYYWVVELFRRLKLPVYDGIHRALEDFNKLRMEKLEREKTEKSKKRLKVERTKDA